MLLHTYIDHTCLSPTAPTSAIKQLCEEAQAYHLHAVCVHGCYVALARNFLHDTSVAIAGVVGFPLGAMTQEMKIAEAKDCIVHGCSEIDMVINLGFVKSGLIDLAVKEVAEIKAAIKSNTLKVILETGHLQPKELEILCQKLPETGADFLKTSTGFGPRGAALQDIETMKAIVGSSMQIKASGGIKDYATALEFIKAGASRIGTSSGIAVVTHKPQS